MITRREPEVHIKRNIVVKMSSVLREGASIRGNL